MSCGKGRFRYRATRFRNRVARYRNRPTKKKPKTHSSTDSISTSIAFHAIVRHNIDRCSFHLSIAPDSLVIY